jgi:site-specific DNA recombinase
MYVRTKGTSYVCSECGNRVGEEDLEAVFIDQLKDVVLSPERIAQNLERADQALSGKQKELSALEVTKAEVASEMEKLYRLFVSDHISGQLFSERNSPLEERLRQLEDEIPKVQGETDFLRLQLRSSTEVLSEARDLYSRWPKLLFAERRQIVESITDRILVGDNEITIQLAYLPNESRPPPKGGSKASQTPVPAVIWVACGPATAARR